MKKNKLTKKVIKAQSWENALMNKLRQKDMIWQNVCEILKPLTKEEIKNAELNRKKEEKRRAKKITITVGEYEDLKSNQCNDDW